MSIFNTLDLAESKLIVLYAIDKFNIPITNNQLTNIMLENNIMNFFSLQQYLTELQNTNFIDIILEDEKEFYSITVSGKEILNYFIDRVPFTAKEKIEKLIQSNMDKVKHEIQILADYMPESETEYIAQCQVKENKTILIDLKINVPTKAQAKEICENWRNNTSAIFTEILDSITKKRE